MSKIDDLISKIEDVELRNRIYDEVRKLKKQKKFGLVYEEHLPEATILYDVPVKRGASVVKRDGDINEVYCVSDITGDVAHCMRMDATKEVSTFNLNDIVVVAQFGKPIYPFVKKMDSVCNAPDSDLWHMLIEADNYHALQLLVYLYGGKVDCIYIDPPYNTGAKDWKYNNDYVDGNDAYRHSKWLSFMEHRLKLAKRLLNPKDSVLIVTIDEKEYLHLGCLLEQMFPDVRIDMISSNISRKGIARTNRFTRNNEYIYFVMLGSSKIEAIDVAEYAKEGQSIHWQTFRRSSIKNKRHTRPNQFYPIYVNKETNAIVKIGDSISPDVDIKTFKEIDNCIPVFPIRDDGTEMLWGVTDTECRKRAAKGYLRASRYTPDKPQKYVIQYLMEGTINDIDNGRIIITGTAADGSVIGENQEDKNILPRTQWNFELHDARDFGSKINKAIFTDARFDFPKSLYAVHDSLRYFLNSKPNALVLDFFAGSGTTLNAVNLLNKEDGGRRRCIMVTNNEIGEYKEAELKPQGVRQGDEEWEKWGIARYVTWPRTKCSILGVDINGEPVEGEYITSLTETKTTDRKFTQINYTAETISLKQKKTLATLINKQKDIKLPTMSADAPFLISEEDDCNASILFDVNAVDAWLEALDGNTHITNFYIVTPKDADYKRIKKQVVELMGSIEEAVPVKIPMADGFKSNAIFFKLGFLDKTEVAFGRNLKELIPLLWMKANAIGECPNMEFDTTPDMIILPQNKMAILVEEDAYPKFKKEVENNDIETVFIITDSEDGYREMTSRLNVRQTYQLYRDYLDNFTINK